MEAQLISPEMEKIVDKSTVGFSEEVEQEKKNAITLYDKVQFLSVITSEDYTFADGLLKDVKAKYKFLEDTEESMIKPMRDGYNSARKKIIDFFSSPKEKLEKARFILNKNMIDWAEEQKRKERELERNLQEKARKRAEEEALRQALEAEQAGEKEEAEAILKEEVYVPPIRVASEIPKSKESHIRETWSAQVVDLMELVKGIASGKVAIQAIEANMSFLNTQARHYRETMSNAFPGIVAISKKTQI